MDCHPISSSPTAGAAFHIAEPREPRSPLVVASPHSGRDYPAEFLAETALDPLTLRRSEDSFVDELFGSAPDHGAPLLRALFPRAYLDVNREPFELDPTMFEGGLPPAANISSTRVAAGLGTIPRIVAKGTNIYRGKLPAMEAERRIRDLYFPYHEALSSLIAETRARFDYCLVLDCHSMPSMEGNAGLGPTLSQVDIVLGDCFGASCAPAMKAEAERILAEQGYRVVKNVVYAGGYTTRHYGHPEDGVHVMQIEVNRSLYMNEVSHRRSPRFRHLERHMNELLAALAALPADGFLP